MANRESVVVRKPTITAKICFSGCIFFAILCACLLAALVLIGKHLHENATITTLKNPAATDSGAGSNKTKVLYSAEDDQQTVVEVLPEPNSQFWRLPNDTYPLKYNLHLEPDLIRGTFKGYVNITLNMTGSRNNVILHANNLSLISTDLFRLGEYTSRKLDITNVEVRKKDQVLVVHLKSEASPGVYLLNIQYTGSLYQRVGFYKSSYKHKSSNESRPMATSKFEPTYARQAYPCFDEPDKKAKFTIHLVKPKDTEFIALSNMPQKTEVDVEDGKKVRVSFEESVKMSTYLSCFIVSDFKYTNDTINSTYGDIELRVYSTPAQLNKTYFALEVGKKVTEYFINEYFKIAYPLPKLDMVAIPDFVSGAMEHWGLITFRETSLLFDEATSSTINQQRIAVVVAHEIAHSWFGNLVTMKWWNDLWLNEGFATYISFKGIDKILPEWEMLNQFPVEQLHSVLQLDATLASHPIIVNNILTPDEITEVFDTITYNKGASVLRMLENAVGSDNFENGVNAYLNKYAFDNAKTEFLLNELQEIVGNKFNVIEFMNTFTEQMGYPIIKVVKSSDNTFVLKQERFLTNRNVDSKKIKESPFNYKWTIPVTYITDKDQQNVQNDWLNYSDESITIQPVFDKWFKINHDQIGYYRVSYPEEIWIALSDSIKDMKNADKAHLLEEAFSIAEAQYINYTIPLELTKFLSNDFNYVPWAVAAGKLNQIKNILFLSNAYGELQQYVKMLVDSAYNQLGWNVNSTDKHLEKRLRVVILDLACSFGHEESLEEANRLFKNWINNTIENPLPQDTKSLVINYGMKSATEKEWNILFEKFAAETDANEKLRYMSGLSSIKETWLLAKLIDLARTEEYVRSQDYFTLLQYISSNPAGTALVWDYVRENWEWLVNRFTLNDRYLGRLIPAITKTFSSQFKLDEMKAFFEKYEEAGAGAAARNQALETVQNNINWLVNNKEIVIAWLKTENQAQ